MGRFTREIRQSCLALDMEKGNGMDELRWWIKKILKHDESDKEARDQAGISAEEICDLIQLYV